jgi:hypothetical protein
MHFKKELLAGTATVCTKSSGGQVILKSNCVTLLPLLLKETSYF